MTSATGPQVANQPQPDPRFALFDAPLSYSPLTMSFDAALPIAFTPGFSGKSPASPTYSRR